LLSLLALLLTATLATAQQAKLAAPTSADARLVVTQFAAAPEIAQPIALDFDAKGRLLVVESHTHFRPAKYDGPKADRVRVLEDADGDGKADKFTTFFEGLTHTMDLAVHFDGSVYVATRNEILRLRDTDNDGKADEKTRVMFLDTKGNYPHNGLAGLSFDSRGDLTFGMGENLGADYKLVGADGTTLSGGGEGGNVYHCTANGKKLRRVATGFWNPFGSGRDIFGRLFVVDNDPDASPPCRLLHVVEGGDYGFQFRYGRAGRHPFQAWNGELPGTLPMVAGTGESPCEVISYESDGLPAEYRGELLVPAWADHRVERYTLKPRGASFTAERKPFIQGTKDFYPSGLAVAPDGSLFLTDWGSRSYELHGKGAVWQVKWKDAKPAPRPKDPKEALLSADRKTREAAARELAKDRLGLNHVESLLDSRDVRLLATALATLIDADHLNAPVLEFFASNKKYDLGIRELAARSFVGRGVTTAGLAAADMPGGVRAEAIRGLGGDPAGPSLLNLLADADPFLRHAAVRRAGGDARPLKQIAIGSVADPRQRVGLLLAYRTAGERDGLAHFLKDADLDVRLLAVKWVSDEKLVAFRPQVAEMMKQPNLDPRSYVALATTLARLDDKPVNEDSLAGYFLERLADKSATPTARLMALRAIPANHNRLKLDQLTELLKQDDAALRVEVLRALKDRGDPKAAPVVLTLAKDAKQPAALRAQALVTLSAMNATPADLLIELVGGPDAALRQEALRALVGAKLTAKQQEDVVAAVVKSKDDLDQSLARVFAKPLNANRPMATDTAAWLARLDGPADPEAGRRVLEHSKLAACSKCHQVDGRGANVGPDLSLIGRTDRKWIVESILQPTAVVAPHYQAWTIQTTDERTRTGLLVHTQLDESTYLDDKGNRFKVTANELLDVKAARVSIMPEKLLDTLTDQEIRDLVAYLASRK
jgi:putative membrane-bound dehydrogenase-like protein